MKKTILINCIILLLISCSEKQKTKDELIKESIASELKKAMKDSESYEFVSMEITETFNVKQRKEIINEEKLNEIKEMSKEIDVTDLLNHTEKELAFLNKQTDNTKEAVYYVNFTAKGKNSFGATVKNDYSVTVLNDDIYTVLSLK